MNLSDYLPFSHFPAVAVDADDDFFASIILAYFQFAIDSHTRQAHTPQGYALYII